MGREADEHEDDPYEDDAYEDDDEYESEPPPRGEGDGGRATLGDPMAQRGHFVRRKPPAPAVPRVPRRPGPAKPSASVGGVDALQRIREQREQANFRNGFIWGAGVVATAACLLWGVVVATDGGEARRIEMAGIELGRVQELAEIGDAEAGDLRIAQLIALIAGPAHASAQLELARQHHALGQITEVEIGWIESAANLVDEGHINGKVLAVTRTPEVDRALAAAEREHDGFKKKRSISAADVAELDGEDLDGRDVGLGDLARAQRKNRETMRTANKTGGAMLEAAGKDPADAPLPTTP